MKYKDLTPSLLDIYIFTIEGIHFSLHSVQHLGQVTVGMDM